MKHYLENEKELLKNKPQQFKKFYRFVKKIYYECKDDGYSQGRELWEDFPYDFYTDIKNWIEFNNMWEIKRYINDLKEYYPHIEESADMFWDKWLDYKNNK